MHKLHYITYISPHYIKLKYFMNLQDKDNLRRKDKSSVPKVSFFGGSTVYSMHATEQNSFSNEHIGKLKHANYVRLLMTSTDNKTTM